MCDFMVLIRSIIFGIFHSWSLCHSSGLAINGGWGSWSSFSSCSKTCGGGTKRRTRRCNNPTPAYGGADCSGAASETSSCNTDHCPAHSCPGDRKRSLLLGLNGGVEKALQVTGTVRRRPCSACPNSCPYCLGRCVNHNTPQAQCLFSTCSSTPYVGSGGISFES